ncbi:MAG: hypothetical protein R3293_11450 [Candidatus Promineifilaceae bacterium]|nr:hypothetical protein [Candidatus Promineifilaceae bacterium]
MVRQISRENFRRAEKFINTSARPLEAALFAIAFREGTAGWVLKELAEFQNEDGGFGRGLEPDLQLPDSSVLATTVALQILRDLRVDSSSDLVQGAMRYLLANYDAGAKSWPIIPANVDDAPHAPWWQYDPDLSRYLSNPRAEIASYLFDYADQIPDGFGQSILADVLSHLESLGGQVEMHELLCYLRLLNTESLPVDARAALIKELKPVVLSSVALDSAAWDQYKLKPLQVCPTPTAPFAPLLGQAIEDNLDYEIEKQLEDGAWAPAWSWGESFPAAWPHALRAWKGVLTVNTLRSLSAYGRISTS